MKIIITSSRYFPSTFLFLHIPQHGFFFYKHHLPINRPICLHFIRIWFRVVKSVTNITKMLELSTRSRQISLCYFLKPTFCQCLSYTYLSAFSYTCTQQKNTKDKKAHETLCTIRIRANYSL